MAVTLVRAEMSSWSPGREQNKAMPEAEHPPSKRRLRDRIPAPLRHGVTVFVLLIIVEYLVIPELERAHLDQIEHIGIAWMLGGLACEAASLFTYNLLALALLPKDSVSLFTIARIDLAGTAVSHVVPGGSAASAALGYRILTQAGVDPAEVGFAMASKGIGSAVVLNVMLWCSLVVSIPLAGFHRVYVVVALVGLILLIVIALLVYAFTRGEDFAVRAVRSVGSHIPKLGADPLERLIRQLAASMRSFTRDRKVMRRALLWASVNWILDAASLWCFVAALGHYVNPIVLFAAYGIVNVLAVLPFTPSGLGVVEVVLPSLLASSGVSGSVATLAVIGWRLVNFWLPIPIGALAYLSLRVPRGAPLSARRRALHELVTPEALAAAVSADSEPSRADAEGLGGPPIDLPPSDPAAPDAVGDPAMHPELPLPGVPPPPPTRPRSRERTAPRQLARARLRELLQEAARRRSENRED